MTGPGPSRALGFKLFKAVIYGLLSLNILLFFEFGSLSETLDTAGWVLLLALFEIETGHLLDTPSHWRRLRLLHGLRLLAYGLVGYSALAYVLEHAWLDAANTWLWLALAGLIEIGVRRTEAGCPPSRLLILAQIGLFCLLFTIALIWAGNGAWLDFYDAALWLIAFLAIELNLWRQRPQATTAPGA
ncbi:MAG: hypothetical protein AB1697_09145 [Pseudomonadota bacterium]